MSNPETKDELRKYIGNKIRNLRKNANLTQLELSEKIGITTNSLGIYERGSRTPDIDVLLKIAEYFNLSLDELCGNVSKNTESKSKVYKLETVGDLARIMTALDAALGITPVYRGEFTDDDSCFPNTMLSENESSISSWWYKKSTSHFTPLDDNIDGDLEVYSGLLIDGHCIIRDSETQKIAQTFTEFVRKFVSAKEVKDKIKDMDSYALEVYNTLINKAISEADKVLLKPEKKEDKTNENKNAEFKSLSEIDNDDLPF